ncbi:MULTISPECIES: calcium/sodium antiporter [Pseudoalteromonas]|uniref:Calcium/sodium antiporter n=1 Tax=Pseudoalteromonas maricaloris TaxID=184924 RepID=A0A8I2H297_9GAMM|nr:MULTISPECIES: calcium/sodium antiporter [Pseudoalteromonas]KID37696.1 calcium/sodium:proton antiporter [Pseudoalteromonas flavipulchra NCIMB 2033 = ATCC BAA-314]KJZ05383.1 calcium/sodium:proton antiporter [Pseudoalteromonas piscicida]MBD0783894.1 calcium/sodium antiporter [Pseudoalteromonas flavipulchra]MBE0374474.1 cation:H+ antiporter [Pseudoalteromonas flavipulchra NCIMB 2033 = ATCC BAA-314]NLR21806.1 calcium/sodium antiporter [Pseudoalteromonas maricaloris]
MVLSFVILILGFIALVWSADRFVFGAAALARNFGVPTLIVGLTIVAMGSSAPEMMVAAQAALADKTDTAVGNAIGSNIANILLVLGLTALLRPLSVGSGILRREMPLLVIVSLAAWYIVSDNHFSFVEGVLLLVGFAAFLLALIIITKRGGGDNDDPFVSEACEEVPNNIPTQKAVFWLIVGMILLPISADYLVGAAVDIAKYFGMSDLLIGLTIIAVGTSLPELAACVAGVLKKEDDLALGNIIGSNIFNILAVLSIAGIINPSVLDANIASRDIFIMLGATLLLILMSLSLTGKRRINRIEGGILVASFVGYIYYII